MACPSSGLELGNEEDTGWHVTTDLGESPSPSPDTASSSWFFVTFRAASQRLGKASASVFSPGRSSHLPGWAVQNPAHACQLGVRPSPSHTAWSLRSTWGWQRHSGTSYKNSSKINNARVQWPCCLLHQIILTTNQLNLNPNVS